MSISPETVATLGAPYVAATIPAGTYEGQAADVPTAAVINFLVTHEDVPEETVYQMTRLLFENLSALEAAHVAARSIKLEDALTGMPIPLHPGAERFYEEAEE